MRSFFPLLTLSAVSLSPLLCQEKPPVPLAVGSWYTYGDFILLRRMNMHNHSLIDDTSLSPPVCDPCKGQEILSNKQLIQALDFEPGLRVGIGYDRAKEWTLDFSFLFIPEWDGVRRVFGDNTLRFPFSNNSYTHDWYQANEAVGRYWTRFFNAEGNWWYHMTPRNVDYFSVSIGLGARYIGLFEHFDLKIVNVDNRSHYHIDTENNAVGLQTGFNMAWYPTSRWNWDFTLKMGWMGGVAQDEGFLGDYNDTVTLRRYERWAGESIFLTDVALSLTYQIIYHLNAHVGYQVLYFSGVAIAGEQIDKNVTGSGARLDPNGSIFFQGPFAGLTYRF